MSDAAITKDSLHHYDNRHIQVRWDFFDLCAYDKSQFNCRLNGNGKIIKDEPNQECAAKIIRILETLTNHEKLEWYLDAKRLTEQGLTAPPEPREFPIQLSYGAICDLLYNTYGESTVRNTVAFLIQRGFIKQYQQTKNSIPFYVLEIHAVQQALKDQAEKSLSGVEINSQTGESFQVLKSTAKPLKSTAKPLKSTEVGVEINNNNISKKDNKGKKERTPQPEIDSTQMDTPSSSHSSTPSSSSEEKQSDASLIANTATQNEEAVTTRNTTPSSFSEEEKREIQRIAGYWKRLGYTKLGAPEHWLTLSEHIHNFEDMESLFKHTQFEIRDKPNKRVYPGNLVDHLDGWKQARAPAPEKPKQSKPYIRDLAAEHRKMVEQYGKPSNIAATGK